MRQGCLGTGSELVGRVVAAHELQVRLTGARWKAIWTYLLPSTRVEGHDHSVHEGDVELFGEVENALESCELGGKGLRSGATYLHGGDGIDGRVRGVVVVVVDVEPLTEPRKAKGCGGKWAKGADL